VAESPLKNENGGEEIGEKKKKKKQKKKKKNQKKTAEEEVEEVAQEEKLPEGHVIKTLEVEKEFLSVVIGVNGSKLQQVADLFHVNATFDNCVITIKGHKDQVAKAMAKIENKMAFRRAKEERAGEAAFKAMAYSYLTKHAKRMVI